jgi:hypothetical protein
MASSNSFLSAPLKTFSLAVGKASCPQKAGKHIVMHLEAVKPRF